MNYVIIILLLIRNVSLESQVELNIPTCNTDEV